MNINGIDLWAAPEWLPILRHAEVDVPTYNDIPCAEAAGPLGRAARRIESDPDIFRPLAAAGPEDEAAVNGEATVNSEAAVNGVLALLHWGADKCAEHPAATLRFRIRTV